MKNGGIDRLLFFLNGVVETAKNSIATFESIVSLRESYNKKLLRLGSRAKGAEKLLNFMYSNPFVNNIIVSSLLGVSFSTSNRLINALVKDGVLKEVTGYTRNRLFVLEEYLRIFKR